MTGFRDRDGRVGTSRRVLAAARRFARAHVCTLALVLAPATAAAQPAGAGAPRFDLGGGVALAGGSALGGSVATETPNQAGPGSRLTLFRADARLQRSVGFTGHLGVRLSPTLTIEGTVTYARPTIATTIAEDFEGATPGVLRGPRVRELAVEAGLLVHLDRLRPSARSRPFVRVSAGYLAQMTGEAEQQDAARVYRVGGGLKHFVGAGERLGVRADVLVGIRDGGLTLDDTSRRTFVTAGAGVFARF